MVNRAIWCAGVTVLLLACSDGSAPGDAIPEPGRYRYTYDGLNIRLDPIHFEGTLVLTFVSADSMGGRWEVPGYTERVLHGLRLSDHWFLMANVPSEGIASHDIRPGTTSLPVECRMTYAVGSGTRSFTGDCTLTRE